MYLIGYNGGFVEIRSLLASDLDFVKCFTPNFTKK